MRLALQKLTSWTSSKESRKIVANTGWLFAGRFLRMAVGLLVGVWVARYLGVSQFGLFSYATAFVALFSPLSSLGLRSLVIRSITHEPEKSAKILGTTLGLQFIGAVVTTLGAIGTIFVVRQGEPLILSLVAILASAQIFRAFEAIDLWFQSQVQAKYTVIAKNLAFLTLAIVKVILIYVQAPLLLFAVATLAEAVVAAIGLFVAYQIQGYSLLLWRWSSALAKTLLKESWPLILSGLFVVVYLKIDQIMLGEIVGNQAVGLYSSAAKISEVWYFIPSAVVSSVAPSIYAAKKAAQESLYYRRIGQLLSSVLAINILIALPISFFSKEILIVLFGHDYAAASLILAIHIWALFFVSLGVCTTPWFIAEGLSHLSFRRTLVGALTNILLNALLIPVLGGVGAAIATLVSYAWAGFFFNGLDSNTRKLFKVQIKAIFMLNRQ